MEGLLQLSGEAAGDVGEVVVESVTLSSKVYAVEVADALGLDQRSDGPGQDAERPALGLGPIRVEPGVGSGFPFGRGGALR
jgi:hypothetical protein